MKKTTRLRQLFMSPEIFVLAGGSNALEATILDKVGFQACYMSGAGTAAALTGLPDAGLTTMTEVVMNAGYMAQAIDVPLVSDSDTGYGNAINVRRTVQSFIRAGVAGIHIEDQVAPKRCGFVAGKQVISMEEAEGKYRAAVDARNELDEDFIIIARTDARGAVGGTLDEAIRRSHAYRRAGADIAYVEALQSMDEVRRCVEEIGPPIMFTLSAIPDAPRHAEMERMGISCAFYPGLAKMLTYRINWEYLHDVKQRDVEAIKEWQAWEDSYPWKHPAPPHRFDLVGFPEVREWEEKYLPPEEFDKYAESIGTYTPGAVANRKM
jgi:2-methylisocitrate lyase-like PEP mutase family enzyme